MIVLKLKFMKNLENYGVQEMNTNEMREVDGGGTLAKWFGYVIGSVQGTVDNFFNKMSEGGITAHY